MKVCLASAYLHRWKDCACVCVRVCVSKFLGVLVVSSQLITAPVSVQPTEINDKHDDM